MRAEGDADADLVAALGDEVREHSVQADHDEHRGEQAEEAGEHGHHAVADQAVLNILLEVQELQASCRDVRFAIL